MAEIYLGEFHLIHDGSELSDIDIADVTFGRKDSKDDSTSEVREDCLFEVIDSMTEFCMSSGLLHGEVSDGAMS